MAYPAADIILTGGRVWCGLAEGDAEAIALWSGRVLATGTAAEVAGLAGPETRVVDLDGRLATPGLNDAHLHLLPLGLVMAQVDVRADVAPTLEDLKAAIRARAAVTPKGDWVLARGYDDTRFQSGLHPTVDDLDEAAPDHPVYLVRTCGHLSVVNSRAMALAGLTAGTPVPPGGLIETRDGRLTGLLAENGRDPVKAVLPEPTDAELVDAIERAGLHCLSHGVTSVMDAAVGMAAGRREFAAYRAARRTGRLPVRTYLTLLAGERGIAAEAVADGLVSGEGDDLLRIGGIKLFTDGSAGGRTAAMTRPYLGEPPVTGVLCLDDETCHAEIRRYHEAGCRMAIHAIGDAAIEQVLSGLEKALDASPAPDRRHRIEHCGFVTDDQLARMRARGIYPAPQPSFIREMGDGYVALFEEERLHRCYPMRTWREMGLDPSASTDAPVTRLDPLANLHAMATRRTRTGARIGPDQALSLAEALDAYTRASAFAEHAETRKGRLVPGQLADVAVFDRDFLDEDPEILLGGVACDMAIREGRVVFERAA